jgi:hypothetical protein
LRRREGIYESQNAHVVAKIAAWKSSVNR